MSETETAPTGTPVRRFVDRHLALLSALALVVLATFRVYFVAGFDLPTALSVLAIVDRAQLLTATVLAGLAFIIPLVFIQPVVRKWMWAGNVPGAPFSTQVRTALVWVPLSVVVIFGITLPLLAGWFVGWLLLIATRARARRKAIRAGLNPPDAKARPVSKDWSTWLLATVLGWTLMTVMYMPWLAKEAVHVSGDERAMVGYVVGVQGDMTLILKLPGSVANWVQTDDINGRVLCRDTPQWTTSSLAGLLPREGEDCASILRAQREEKT